MASSSFADQCHLLRRDSPFPATQARKRLACVCVDEVHEMGTNRGATLESFLCKVACVGAPVVACTATASNLGALAAWLGAGLYETAECPTTVAIHLALAPPMPRRMMAPTEEVATRIWAEGGARVDERRLAVTAPADYDVGDAVVDKLCLDDPPGPVMLFVASRADARAAAVRLAERRWRESGGAQEKAACRAALAERLRSASPPDATHGASAAIIRAEDAARGPGRAAARERRVGRAAARRRTRRARRSGPRPPGGNTTRDGGRARRAPCTIRAAHR